MERIEKLKDFLEKQPADSFLQHALALEYIKQGNDDEARNLFEKLLASNPKYVGSYYHLAKLLERQNLYEEAISIYEKGILAAQMADDNHARNELQMALDDII